MNVKIFSLVILMFAFPQSVALGQNRLPSYEDTMMWLQSKVRESTVTLSISSPQTGVRLEIISGYRLFAWSGCTVTVVSDGLVMTSRSGNQPNKSNTSSSITFNLADMSPNVGVTPIPLPAVPGATGWSGGGYDVKLFVTSGEGKIRDVTNGKTIFSPQFYLLTHSRNTAQRMANALSTAIKQCGGKPEPF